MQAFPSSFRFPDGESFMEMQARMRPTLDRLADRHQGETFVAVSHADPIKAAVAATAGVPLDLFQRLAVSPCSVTALVRGQNRARTVLCVNSTASLAELAVVMSPALDLGDLDRFTVGTEGPVGERVFLLQCRSGRTVW